MLIINKVIHDAFTHQVLHYNPQLSSFQVRPEVLGHVWRVALTQHLQKAEDKCIYHYDAYKNSKHALTDVIACLFGRCNLNWHVNFIKTLIVHSKSKSFKIFVSQKRNGKLIVFLTSLLIKQFKQKLLQSQAPQVENLIY